MYPKLRLDALTDGIFAVAMTILVLDLRLPEEFHAVDDNAMARALLGLWPKFLPYALSFYRSTRSMSAHPRWRAGLGSGAQDRWPGSAKISVSTLDRVTFSPTLVQ
jgi:Endosomal/lysosomal potassium channel TMEM175